MWPFSKPKQQPVKAVIRRAFKMSLDEWRKNQSLVEGARKLMADPIFAAMIDVLQNESPLHYVSTVQGLQPSDHIKRLGEIEGYQLPLNMLPLFAVPLEDEKQIEATFAPEEAPEHIRVMQSNPEE